MVCGFDYVRDYRLVRQNFGSTVGRYIGRILDARFTLDGTEYRLQGAGRGHISHGGSPGFADRVWEAVACSEGSLTLAYDSPDGENGFPGHLHIEVTFTLDDRNTLAIEYAAATDRPTVLNPSNHSFFNIGGDLSATVLGHCLRVPGDSIAECDDRKCVTGRFVPVAGTEFDFREFHPVGERIDTHETVGGTACYDHTWQVPGWNGQELCLAAEIVDPASGRTLSVWTTEPGVHIYTAGGHDGSICGKGGVAYPRRNAVCFETMHFSDSPNRPQFPSTALRPGDRFRSRTEYRFGCLKDLRMP